MISPPVNKYTTYLPRDKGRSALFAGIAELLAAVIIPAVVEVGQQLLFSDPTAPPRSTRHITFVKEVNSTRT